MEVEFSPNIVQLLHVPSNTKTREPSLHVEMEIESMVQKDPLPQFKIEPC